MSGAFAVGMPAPKAMVTNYGMCEDFLCDQPFVTFEKVKFGFELRDENIIYRTDWSGLNTKKAIQYPSD